MSQTTLADRRENPCKQFNEEKFYSFRKRFQKLEFSFSWILILLIKSCYVSSHSMLLIPPILWVSTRYIQVSIVSRTLAYIVDFKNAQLKLETVPWGLIFHHGGVLILHCLTAFIFQKSESEIIMYLASAAASHSTFIKKFSFGFYWFNNLFFGAFNSFVYSCANLMKSGWSLHITVPCIGALFITFIGMWKMTKIFPPPRKGLKKV